MKRAVIVLLGVLLVIAGCGKKNSEETADPNAVWFSSPTKVIEGLMHAYETRNDSLYAALLADDFHYFFEPEGADSADILGWGKEEEVVATGNLFRTSDVDDLTYTLSMGEARTSEGPGRDGWMEIPVSGGEMVVMVKSKDPMRVQLNRQVIVVRPMESEGSSKRWKIVEWHDFPSAGTP